MSAQLLVLQRVQTYTYHVTQATEHDPTKPEMQPVLALDAQRLAALKANLRRGQTIWLELYEQIFGRV